MKSFMKLPVGVGFILTFTLNSLAQDVPEVKNLRTEYLKNPIGIDKLSPRFSWEMESNERSTTQSAYEITVSTSKDGSNPVWNSGKIESDKSVNVEYDGDTLTPSTRYYWFVKIWDNKDTECNSTDTAIFETGLLNSGWGDAKWIKSSTYEQGEVDPDTLTIVDYSISMDFEINQIAAGPCFAKTSAGNYFMWQFNIATDGKEENTVYFRPHQWSNGSVSVIKEVEISDKIKLEQNVEYHLQIDIVGNTATTYINGIKIDVLENPSGENYGYADLGFRQAFNSALVSEQAYFDNIKVTTIVEGTEVNLFEEDFSDTSFAFSKGEIIDGRLFLTSDENGDAYAWQKDTETDPAWFTLEMDVTLQNDNAGIIFSAIDEENMYMWSINTHDQNYPLVRRHVYTNNSPSYSDTPIGDYYSKADLIGVERHLKIDVKNNVIKTYIDDVLVDTYEDASGGLCNGLLGFRAYNSGGTDEIALYDNIILKTYSTNDDSEIDTVITFSEDFEDDEHAFMNCEIVSVSGNNKMKFYSKSGDNRVLEGEGGIPIFRKEFSLDTDIKSAKIYSSALGVYDLFINGQRVGTSLEDSSIVYDELKPGWTNYNKTVQYTTYDVTNLLHPGDNAIGAQVASGWCSGNIANDDYENTEPCFIAKLVIQYVDGSTMNIVTDNTWLASDNGPICMADIYNGETYDARKEMNCYEAGFDDSEWFQTEIYKGFQGELKAFAGTPVRIRPELEREPESITIYNGRISNGSDYGKINTISKIDGTGIIQLEKGDTAVIDFGQNMVGWVRFFVKGESGTIMKLRFGEMLNDSGELSRGNDGPEGSIYTANLRTAKATINYFLKGSEGGESYRPSFTFFGFRYCEVTATRDIQIDSLVAEVVGSVNEEGSSLTTSSPDVNQLYSNIIWGQRSNFLSIPTDCPQRDERLGWTGDTQIFSRAATYNADVAAFFHKWMRDMRDSQREDGAYPDVAPYSSLVGYGNGAWAEAGIIVPWNVYLMYDDLGIIEENYESMEKYMDFLADQADGNYQYNGAATSYGDWVSYESTDSRFISVCYYAYAAQLMSKMSEALSVEEGDDYASKAEKYNSLYENIKTEFRSRYINSSGELGQKTQTAYLLALKLDLFSNETETKNGIDYLVKKIANNNNTLSTGFVGTGILNQTLSQVDKTNTAYNLLLQRNNPSWLYSIDQGATTIWERWNSYTKEDGFYDVDMNSFNHYSYGAVSEWMFRYMAGIEADESTPGFKHFILQPMPDFRTTIPDGQEKITSVNAVYDSYYGEIKSAWELNSDGFLSYTAKVPANSTATLYLPDTTDKIYEGSVLAKDAEGVTFVKKENGRAIYELESGTYSFGLNIASEINDNQTDDDFFIFPNPVHSKLTIAKEPVDYSISDLTGNTIQSGKSEDVNVEGLSIGVYFIRVGDTVYKFIKK